MKKIVFLLLLSFPCCLFAQQIGNVTAQQEEKKIIVQYDLTGKEGIKSFTVELYVSIDGGGSWEKINTGLSGDLGANITAGSSKQINWDVLNDRDKLQGSNIQFKVKAAYTANENYTETAFGLNLQMVKVKGGTFTMGCTDEQGSDCYDDEKPSHSVMVDDYYIGKYEVTYGFVKKVVSYVAARGIWLENPYAYGTYDSFPMTNAYWEWVQIFIGYLNAMESIHKYRLPTEAEWEYAARGGNKSKGYLYSGSNNEDEVAWVKSGYGPSIVGTKKSNELGIYDMTGNVLEWCSDFYGPYSGQAQINPLGPSTGAFRIVRGGSWADGNCRVTLRYDVSDYLYQIYQKGFRIVREK